MRAMLELQRAGAILFDYGNNFRREAENAGVSDFSYPGFVPAFIRPLFCEGMGPFRWVALSGDPEDIYATDRALIEAMPENESLVRWLGLARERVSFQGLPARICWLGYGDRAKAGRIFNELVARGTVKAPIVIGRDHLDSGSVASPNRETESMRDGSDAIADWPVLNALLNTASGATWVSVHHGGGVGIGYSIHAGMVVVADGTPEAARRLERVLTTDPGTGIMRHADAGYLEARRGGAAPRDRSAGDHDVRLVPDLVLTEAGWASGLGVTLDGGRIVSIEPLHGGAPDDVRLARRALVPGTINAHCHTFQSLLRGLGDDLDFAGWRDRVLYPFSERLDRRGIALGAAFAFAEMLQSGVTTCVDFFYLQDAGNANAEAVIEAARDDRDPPRAGARHVRLGGRAQALPGDGRGRGAPDARADRGASPRRDHGGAARAAQPARRVPGDDQGGVGDRGDGDHAVSHPRGRGTLRGRAHARASTAPRRSAISTAWACWARG